jgi:hypothetical protein
MQSVRARLIASAAAVAVVAVTLAVLTRDDSGSPKFCTTGLAVRMVADQRVVLEDQGSPGDDGCDLDPLSGWRGAPILGFDCKVRDTDARVIATSTPNRSDELCGQPEP